MLKCTEDLNTYFFKKAKQRVEKGHQAHKRCLASALGSACQKHDHHLPVRTVSVQKKNSTPDKKWEKLKLCAIPVRVVNGVAVMQTHAYSFKTYKN